MSKYIFRIEHKETKKGPYRNGAMRLWANGSHSDPWRPVPEYEINFSGCFRSASNDFIFGFDNLYQLRSWFEPMELKKLTDLGFRIRRYKRSELTEIIQGEFQVIFKVA